MVFPTATRATVQRGPRLAHPRPRRLAGGGGHARFGLRLLEESDREDLVPREALAPRQVAPGLLRRPARLALGGLGHDERLLRQRELGADVLVDDPDEDVPLLHALALAHGEALDPPADLRAQRGAPSRLHRPGPAPGDGLLHRPARGGDDRDGNRARAGSSVSRRTSGGEEERAGDEAPANPRARHRSIVGACRGVGKRFGHGRLESRPHDPVPPPRRRRSGSPRRFLRQEGAGTEGRPDHAARPSPRRRRRRSASCPEKMPGAEADTPQLVALGKALFFEKRLSVTGTQSCNDCHRLDGEQPVRGRRRRGRRTGRRERRGRGTRRA